MEVFRQNMRKNRGFTLIELMIVVSVIAILSTVGYISLSRSTEASAKAQMKTQIPTFLSGVSDRAYESGIADIITFSSSEITAEKGGTLQLSRRLNYSADFTTLEISSYGNYTASGTITVENKSGNELFKVKIDKIDAIKYSKIIVEE